MTKQLVRNQDLASDVGRANLLTNGGFEIWQRGNGPFTGAIAYSADTWRNNIAGSDTLSVSKNTATVDTGSIASAACTFVLGSGAGVTSLFQWLRFSDGAQIRSKTFSASIRVNTSVANAVRFALVTDGTGPLLIYSSYHTGNSAWQTLTVSGTIPSDATALQLLVYFAASCTAYIDNAMLVTGSVAADYAPLTPADELARCLRYYQRDQPASTSHIFCSGQCASTTIAYFFLPLIYKMYSTPTFTMSATTDFGAWNAGSAGVVLSSGPTYYYSGTERVIITGTTAGSLVGGNATMLCAQTANAWIALEANP